MEFEEAIMLGHITNGHSLSAYTLYKSKFKEIHKKD